MDILIADDDRVSLVKLQRSLEKLGHTVTAARDGAEAWRLLGEGRVHLVVSDWMMPELDGLELCRRIRARACPTYTYVILLTSRDSRDDKLEGLDAGADDFLCKPPDTGELAARLKVAERILDMHDQLRTHAAQLAELHERLAAQNTLLAERASTDALTGLFNRRQFDDALRTAVSYAARHNRPLSLILLDVDHFKAYNDAFGHPAGDEVLRQVAAALRGHSRAHDVVARYGGEEFAVILPSTDANGALEAATRLCETVAEQTWPHRHVTASFGAATVPADAADVDRLIGEADRALYSSKAQGRNRATHHDALVGVAQAGSAAGRTSAR